MASVPFIAVKSHTQKVCSLYKRALRNLEAYYDRRNVYRYQAVLLRERFDKHAQESDMMKAVELLKEGEQELFLIQHPLPRAFATSMGGVAHERVVTPPDWVVDYWHPLEKAHYPEYFKRREQRKKEYIAMWEKEHGPADKHEEKH